VAAIVINVDVDAAVWQEHEAWLERRPRLQVERDRWTDGDWDAAKQMAAAAWDAPGRDARELFLFVAQRALFEHHCRRVDARLAVEASHDAAWLLAVLERTA
jgi:hypothetical protein